MCQINDTEKYTCTIVHISLCELCNTYTFAELRDVNINWHPPSRKISKGVRQGGRFGRRIPEKGNTIKLPEFHARTFYSTGFLLGPSYGSLVNRIIARLALSTLRDITEIADDTPLRALLRKKKKT